MKNKLERRISKRLETRRDVVVAYANSDDFHNAELIDHSSHGVCFHSAIPFQAGGKIYIMTRNKPIDDFKDGFTEAYFKKVIWCRKLGAQYRIGAGNVK